MLLCSRNPLLGGKGDDVIAEITTLRINHDEDIHKFYERIITIQEKLEYSTEIISKTKLVEKYLQAMTKSPVHHHLLQYFIINLNLHIAQRGHNQEHPIITIYTIYQHLNITNAPTQFQLISFKKYKPNISQISSTTATNEMIELPIHETDEVHNIETDTATDGLSTYILQDNQNEQHIIQYNPAIKAFQHHSNHRLKIVCEACRLTGHPASKCFRRGYHFLPGDIQRRISAFNTKYGDTPDNDTSTQKLHKEVLPAPHTKLPPTHINENNK